MSILRCPCGQWLSYVGVPDEFRSWLLSDHDLEHIGDVADGGDGTATYHAMLHRRRDVWHCPQCLRIAIGKKGTAKVEWWRKETS